MLSDRSSKAPLDFRNASFIERNFLKTQYFIRSLYGERETSTVLWLCPDIKKK